jgi:D-glycero-alpha-D-manno-heptose-7-phosphate kinase
MHYALKKNDLMKFAEILHENWVRKKTFVTGISTDKIDKIYEIARKSGAIGGKLTGAGGGGHMLFYCERKNQSKIIKSFKKMNLKHIEFAFSSSGPKLIKAP